MENSSFQKPAAKVEADITKKQMQLLDRSIAFLTGGDDQREKRKKTLLPTLQTNDSNEEEAYGRFITNTLNRFDLYQRMFVKKRIGDVLFEIEYASPFN